MFAEEFVSAVPSPGSIRLHDAPIIVDKDDFEGVQIAARTLSEDFERVTGTASTIVASPDRPFTADTAIIIGSFTQSSLIREFVSEGILDVSKIEGQWESYTTNVIRAPFPGIKKALVIAGSDKRGTIYGVYALSEQIGVSPWYYWAEAPIHKSNTLHAHPKSTTSGPPSVKYRGIFINDEAPSLSGWVHEKIGPKYNVEFYKRVFELLLRLKANFLWPAMWFGYPHPGSSFFTDDTLNQATAHAYGIVMSTSHHEPMQRAMNEWFDTPYYEGDGSWSWIRNQDKVERYFEEGVERTVPYESVITMGMRGEGDNAMNEEDPGRVVREVLECQRGAIRHSHGREDGVPQLIALYKEVQEYYEAGLEIPDDITLLFADDNFGSVRRLPTEQECKRNGGAGIYYHLEYVGVPRSYKWLNSNSCAKVFQQLEHTYNQGADRIWVFNVGDIKAVEVPLTFALSLAWNVNSLKQNELPRFFVAFASRTLHLPEKEAGKFSEMLLKYDRLVALRKHEHIEADTFSLVNYNEAETILSRWQSLLSQAEELNNWIPEPAKPAYFQLLLHPIKASTVYTTLRIAQTKNSLYALQRRNTANKYAKEVLSLFDQDFDVSEEYHTLLDGKWNHIMRQPHYGYSDSWHAPYRDMISGLSYVQTRQDSNPIMGYIGVAVEGHAGVRPGLTNEESDRTHPSRRDLVPGVTLPVMEPYGVKRWFEIYCRGSRRVSWRVESPFEWLTVRPESGVLDPKGDDVHVEVEVEWKMVPEGFDQEVLLDLRSSLGDFEQIHAPIKNRIPPPGSRGFVEADGHISIYAPSFQNKAKSYRILPFLGRGPTGAVSRHLSAKPSPTQWLEYRFFTFTPAPQATLMLEFTFTLDTWSGNPIVYQIQLDNEPESRHRLIPDPPSPGQLPKGWEESVMNCAWRREHKLDLSQHGEYMLKVRFSAQNCVLEKVMIDLGGLRESYLGPEESRFCGERH